METKPTIVTVFPDRARIVRVGKTDVKPGPQQIEITNLPLALEPQSLRASGHGTAKAKLLGVSTKLVNFAETPAETAQELETKIQELTDADANLAARSAVLEKEQKAIDGLAGQSEMFARGLALRNRTPEEHGLILDFLTRRSQAIQTELLALSRSRRDKAKELDRLKRMLQSQQSSRPKQRYSAIVEVEVMSEGTLEVEINYVISQASWRPLYDLRMIENALDLTYLAEISQNTGEDWSGVQVVLSTAEPALSLEIPELDPWYIAPRAPVHLARQQMAKSAAMPPMQAAAAPIPRGLAEDMSAAPYQEPEQDLLVESAIVSAPGASLTYQLSGKADVPGNGEPRKVTVANLKFTPVLDYVSAPKVEEVCYRRAKVKNDSQYSLLAGPAQLFESDTFLGSTSLEFVAPNQEFELVLGSDERLRVNRELEARDVEKAFIVGDRKRIRYAYSISLENLRDAPQTVYVRDQLPLPRDEQIKVRLESVDPKPSEHSHLNLLEWKMTLTPGAKPVIRFEFSVEYPRNLDIVGLP